MVSFPQVSPPNPCMHLSSPPHLPHAPPISVFLIWPPIKYLVSSTEHCSVFHSPYTVPLKVQKSHPAPHSWTPSAYVHPSLRETMFHTHTNEQAKLFILYILIFIFLVSKLEDCTEWQHKLPDFNLILIFSWVKIWSVRVVPKHLNCSMFSKDLLTIFFVVTLPACLSQHVNLYLVFAPLTFRPISYQ
jgi:hypothetical protein